jgi:tRNA(Arg) A34 adenosine deaminase TadA
MHERYMERAIEIARQNPAAPFAALLVDTDTGQVVSDGLDRVRDNPTWHGVIDAINRCAAAWPDVDWTRLCLYTTAEPCCMCQAAILGASIPEVVYGTSIHRLQQLGWLQIDIGAKEVTDRTPFGACRLVGGVLEEECNALFREAIALRSDVLIAEAAPAACAD